MSGDVLTHLYFLDPSNTKPTIGVVAEGEDQDAAPTQNQYQRVPVTVVDARPVRDDLDLDREGFVLRDHRSALRDFLDSEAVEDIYYPEVRELVARTTGACEVVVFDHTVRIQDRERQAALGVREAVRIAHNDYTVKSGPQRLRDLLPAAEAEQRLGRRFGVFNVWRPINGPVENMPLGVCDAGSVAPVDLVATDLVYGDRVGEVYQMRSSEGQRWRYFSSMAPGEAMLFKCYDSLTDGRARFTPHCAFKLPEAQAGARPRESIEARTLAFFD